ncbi:MAG: PLP-dependent lyase/thiolase [Paracoccaceae bacterium]
MLFALQQCEKFGVTPADVMKTHFILTERDTENVDGFSEVSFKTPSNKTMFLRTAEFVDAAVATHSDTALTVVFVGLGVDQNGHIVTEETLSKMLFQTGDIDAIAHDLSYCAGRYNFFIFSAAESRGYCDPNGLLGFTYNTDTGTIASALTLCFEGALVEETAYPKEYREAFGYTRDARVKRLCPNHFLDLATHTQIRHWPRDSLDLVAAGDEDGFAEKTQGFIERHQQVIAALSAHSSPAILPLTGGQDSRILLACAKPVLDDIDVLFTHTHNWASREDALVGKMLAHAENRPLDVYDVLEEDEVGDDDDAIKDLFARHLIARGDTASFELPDTVGDKIETWRLKCIHLPPKGGILMRGHVTDLSKAVLYYRAAKIAAKGKAIPRFVGLRRMMIVPEDISERNEFAPIATESYDAWVAGMVPGMRERVIDFVGIEQYRPYSLSGSFHSSYRNFFICPGNDRRCIELAAALPPIDRMNGKMNALIAKKVAPEFSEIPFRSTLKSWPIEQKKALAEAIDNAESVAQLPSRERSIGPTREIEALTPINTPLRPLKIRKSQVWIKDETCQLGGAFKLRGPSHFLDLYGNKGDIITSASSGNHAIGLSLAGLARGLEVRIFVPENTPPAKLAKIAAAGGRITKVAGDYEAALTTAEAFAEKEGALFVPSYDHSDVVAGNQSMFREICDSLGEDPKTLYVPVGGGGALSGALRQFEGRPTRVIGVEIEDLSRVEKIVFGGRSEVAPPAEPLPPSTEGIAIRTLGAYPAQLIRDADNLSIEQVSVAELQATGRLLWETFGMRAELGACAAVAAALRVTHPAASGTVVAIVTGGNISVEDHEAHVLGK